MQEHTKFLSAGGCRSWLRHSESRDGSFDVHVTSADEGLSQVARESLHLKHRLRDLLHELRANERRGSNGATECDGDGQPTDGHRWPLLGDGPLLARPLQLPVLCLFSPCPSTVLFSASWLWSSLPHGDDLLGQLSLAGQVGRKCANPDGSAVPIWSTARTVRDPHRRVSCFCGQLDFAIVVLHALVSSRYTDQ